MNPAAEHIKQTIRLADLVPGLKRHGRYWVGPCPLCGEGVDRFNVTESPAGDLWVCRKCAPDKYHDVPDFLMRRDGLTFVQVLERYGDGPAPAAGTQAVRPPARPPVLDTPPDDDWQIAALKAAAECADYLRSDAPDARRVWRYLVEDRKLMPATLDAWMLGYNPAWRDVAGGRLAPGITIPSMADGQFWYLKTRVTKAARQSGRVDKYHALKGGRLASLFGADRLLGSRVAIVVEGEFDAMLLGQYTDAAVTTMGGSGNMPSVTWLRYFAAVDDVVLLLDDDDAGRAALVRWQALIPRARAAHLPDGSKDATDFCRLRGNVVAWAAAVLREAQS